MKRLIKHFVQSMVGLVTLFLLFGFAAHASAHVAITPQEVTGGTYQVFSIGIPTEKTGTTVKVRLLIPDGVTLVVPNVKVGWKIETKRDATTSRVTEITWSGGSIPAGQRDDFLFSAKMPATEGPLSWKVYQTYADNSLTSWDRDPNYAEKEESSTGPYAVTSVTNTARTAGGSERFSLKDVPTMLSVVALILALGAVIRTRKMV